MGVVTAVWVSAAIRVSITTLSIVARQTRGRTRSVEVSSRPS